MGHGPAVLASRYMAGAATNLGACRNQVLVNGTVPNYSSGNGNWSHHGRSTGSTWLTHLTHQKPRRPGAASLTGAPWPRRSGSPP